MDQAIEERGQVEMVCSGKTYVLQLSPYALSVLKKRTSLGLKGIINALGEQDDDPDFELIGSIIWAATRDHHPEMTFEAAAGLFPPGGLDEIVEVIGKVLAAAFPKSTATRSTESEEENPPKAATKKST